MQKEELLTKIYLYLIKFQFLVQFLFFLGGNVICLDFWGRKSGPYIQALHFCLSLGLLTGPLLVDPLSQTHVPNVLQKALPFALSHPGKIVVGEEWYFSYKHSRHFTFFPLMPTLFCMFTQKKCRSFVIKDPVFLCVNMNKNGRQ